MKPPPAKPAIDSPSTADAQSQSEAQDSVKNTNASHHAPDHESESRPSGPQSANQRRPANARRTNAFVRVPNPRRFTRAVDLASDLANTLIKPTQHENENTGNTPKPATPSFSPKRYSDHVSRQLVAPRPERHPERDPADPDNSFPPSPPSTRAAEGVSDTGASRMTDEMTRLSAIWRNCCIECLNAKGLPGDTGNGEDLGARLVWLDNGEGLVYAQSSVWATRVRMMSPTLVACLRQGGLPELNQLRVRVQPVEQTAPAPKQRPKLHLSEKSGEILDRLANRTGDPDLAASLQRLARHKRS